MTLTRILPQQSLDALNLAKIAAEINAAYRIHEMRTLPVVKKTPVRLNATQRSN